MKTKSAIASVLIVLCCAATTKSQDPLPHSALKRMDVREVAVFKDGHAFVLHSGQMPTDPDGNVRMDYLPTPVLGTFWPYANEKNAELTAVLASRRKVIVSRTALNLIELLRANVGADVIITEVDGKCYPARIEHLPSRASSELELNAPPGVGEVLPQLGQVVLLKTDEGTKVVDINRIRDITFKEAHNSNVENEEFRNLLTLQLSWKDKARPTADVGIMYLQKGIRWIPHYKVDIDGNGSATVKLQGTIINELVDLEDVKVHLVIGVPTFRFSEMVDPISLQQQAVQLSQYFRRDSQTAYALSNAIMSQAAEREAGATSGPRPPQSPEVTGSQQTEDLFVFDVEHITLKKGQRMVLPIAEFKLPYRDVFTLRVPFTPPAEAWGDIQRHYWQASRGSRDPEVARLMSAPKFMHQIRLTNKSEYPLTTAPAMIFSEDTVLGQGMISYTPVGADVDLLTTAAVNIEIEKEETETNRKLAALRWNNHDYARIDLAGRLKLTNYHDKPVELEITRYVLGNVGEADRDGVAEMINALEDPDFLPAGGRVGAAPWWRWYNWPNWWFHHNGVGRIRWNLILDKQDSAELNYTWYYYWY
ncbi:MAG: hypothetical protein ACYSTL_00590 [Planctomycetota bacterium]